ncbi:tetratricopeptide repeat protein [Mesorhizobium sp.]|uniref:tetratricopeptide repeat protein n=1 Tax=Mesorhizobium sp. TaxID=1871066 RepID=UPI000FE89719|nr:tetratricopeptide repeat protein [Mesorhizobium sp.]RWK57814.1 MAG: tetratricopeptide repeat protein [Mesorhizobium sp.]RWL02308.1 MAG: tetratricopeptide repeat protein [Mesorhizobium sp.]TIP46676.1 MAG: tetratricopeptide repeat protein [Mesorhizobium sp.]
MQSNRKISLRALAGSLMLASSMLAVTASAHEQTKTELYKPGVSYAAGSGKPTEGERPPLYKGLGDLTMPITTKSKKARAYFDQGLRLTWGFNHAEARRSFQEAQRLDPECAMCYWGEAFVLGPNINDAMHEEAKAPARDAIQRAEALKAGTGGKERALIEALVKRYGANPTTSRPPLDRAWAEAMGNLAKAYPDDANILVFYADALMNLQPWDYWEADGLTPKGQGGEIMTALERALEVDPKHPAAAHLYIHAVEASADPSRAEAVADRLRGSMPAAGHLVHMPAHIYARVGRHADSIAVNRDAIKADEAFLAQSGEAASALYRFGYYPHNVHYLLVSAQMAGVRDDVIGSAEKLATITSDDVSQKLAWVQAIKAAPFSAHAQFSDPDTILALPSPGDRFPFVKGYWHYARGVALAFKGDLEAASSEAEAIEQLIDKADMSSLEEQYLPAKDVLGIAKFVVEARIAQARRDYVGAERHLNEAIRLQDGISYMEPSYWYYPVRQTLGAVLLQQGRAEEAIAAFEKALQESPRNGWALWGLLKAQTAGNRDTTDTKAAFAQAWLGDERLLSLGRL